MNLVSTPLYKLCFDKSSHMADQTNFTAELTKDSCRKLYEQQQQQQQSEEETLDNL